MMMEIRKATKKHMEESLEIARDLKEWFTKEALKNMNIDFKINNLFVAVDKEVVVGFLCYNSKDGIMNFIWAGVKREFQRKGIGRNLLDYVVSEARKLGMKTIEVETLTEEEDYKPYELTRNFYKKYGFKKIYTKRAVKKGWDDVDVMELEI